MVPSFIDSLLGTGWVIAARSNASQISPVDGGTDYFLGDEEQSAQKSPKDWILRNMGTYLSLFSYCNSYNSQILDTPGFPCVAES